ncbi:hypothetical protein LTR56_017125 [Elasticomyces elasticus]|nr:hypothetical protein LTR22_021805 [Elasticomyces elasticus]KAK3630980.1 hypothetical protein LTR56_017125 [Elasticomyces elasticus]KAK4908793.1 hypothetical protein LTR49_022359 [Elasticomyces elasticus]KAK4960527.1 hypothetical protein LTR10_003423 [Elasticomyces elasticus]KAK4969691.1 hypothetical protein LTR42_008963 [Elasticomyces elasticus]
MSLRTNQGMESGAEAFAVLTGTFLSGLLMSLYTITMPVLVETSVSAPLLLQQWQRIFDRGHIQGPVLAILTGFTYGYAAWLRASAGESWLPFVLAAVLTFGIVPFTWIFMERINTALFSAVARSGTEKGSVDKLDAERMIIRWSGFHALRSLFPLAGAVMGFLAMLQVIQF